MGCGCLRTRRQCNTLLTLRGAPFSFSLPLAASPTPLPFCVNPPESGAATRLAPPLPLTPRELTGDVIRDPRWERKRQTPRGRQRRFLSFVKTRDLISPSKGESQSSPNHLHFALLLAKPRRPCSVLLRVGARRWHFSPFNHLEENLGAEKYVFLP